MGCYYLFYSCQETRPSLSEQDVERGNEKREMDELRREFIKEKGYNIQEMWECEWLEHFKTDSSVKNHVKKNFLYRRPLSTDSLLEKNKERISFWLYNRRVEDHILNFPLLFKNMTSPETILENT